MAVGDDDDDFDELTPPTPVAGMKAYVEGIGLRRMLQAERWSMQRLESLSSSQLLAEAYEFFDSEHRDRFTVVPFDRLWRTCRDHHERIILVLSYCYPDGLRPTAIDEMRLSRLDDDRRSDELDLMAEVVNEVDEVMQQPPKRRETLPYASAQDEQQQQDDGFGLIDLDDIELAVVKR